MLARSDAFWRHKQNDSFSTHFVRNQFFQSCVNLLFAVDDMDRSLFTLVQIEASLIMVSLFM